MPAVVPAPKKYSPIEDYQIHEEVKNRSLTKEINQLRLSEISVDITFIIIALDVFARCGRRCQCNLKCHLIVSCFSTFAAKWSRSWRHETKLTMVQVLVCNHPNRNHHPSCRLRRHNQGIIQNTPISRRGVKGS